jgi:hypothetical protein
VLRALERARHRLRAREDGDLFLDSDLAATVDEAHVRHPDRPLHAGPVPDVGAALKLERVVGRPLDRTADGRRRVRQPEELRWLDQLGADRTRLAACRRNEEDPLLAGDRAAAGLAEERDEPSVGRPDRLGNRPSDEELGRASAVGRNGPEGAFRRLRRLRHAAAREGKTPAVRRPRRASPSFATTRLREPSRSETTTFPGTENQEARYGAARISASRSPVGARFGAPRRLTHFGKRHSSGRGTRAHAAPRRSTV